MTPDTSPPPPVAEPDTLCGELLDRLTALADEALGGSTYAAGKLTNALHDYAPSLIAPLMERCGRARRRRIKT